MSGLGASIDNGPCHGTCVYWPTLERGAIILGPSGSGKSDLALRLIDRGWILVGDDHVQVHGKPDAAYGAAMPALAGQMQVAGLPILTMPFHPRCQLALAVQLESDPPRFPLDKGVQMIAGAAIATIRINGLSASAPLRVEWAMRQALL